MPSLAEQAQTIADLYSPPAVGRPSDIGSSSTVQQFLEAIGEGNYVETAAKLAGLSKQVVYNWIKRGHAGESPFDAFVDALEKAEARAEAHLVRLQRKAAEAGPQYWPAAATQLERRHPDRWGKRQDDTQAPRVVVQIGVGQGEVKVGLALSPSTFAPDSPIEDSAKSLTGSAFALPSSPITAVMVTNGEACQAQAEGSDRQLPAGESPGGPYPGGEGAGGQGGPAVGKGKGRSRAKKEKGR